MKKASGQEFAFASAFNCTSGSPVNRPFKRVPPPAWTPFSKRLFRFCSSVGKERLTTTRVAVRAGVSVGTLYQYFPNKSALLQAALKRHLDEVTEAVESVCRERKGDALAQMATALINAFLEAKMRDAENAASPSIPLAPTWTERRSWRRWACASNQAIVEMLATAREPLTKDPQLVAAMLQGAMAGVSRRLLESEDPEEQFDALRQELIVFACAYLEASSARPATNARSAR